MLRRTEEQKATYILYSSQIFSLQMINRGGGSIINMASVASSLRGYNRRCVYGATKAAVVGLTKGLAMEHVRDGVR